VSIGLHEIEALAAQPRVDLVVQLAIGVGAPIDAGLRDPRLNRVEFAVADPEAVVVDCTSPRASIKSIVRESVT
jgi:hypothetical protein